MLLGNGYIFQIVIKNSDYMKYIAFYHALETAGMYVFDINDALKLFPADRKVVKQQIYYWKKLGWLKSLKKGLS